MAKQPCGITSTGESSRSEKSYNDLNIENIIKLISAILNGVGTVSGTIEKYDRFSILVGANLRQGLSISNTTAALNAEFEALGIPTAILPNGEPSLVGQMNKAIVGSIFTALLVDMVIQSVSEGPVIQGEVAARSIGIPS